MPHDSHNLGLAKFYSLNCNIELFEQRMTVLGAVIPIRLEANLLDAAHQNQLDTFGAVLEFLATAFSVEPTPRVKTVSTV